MGAHVAFHLLRCSISAGPVYLLAHLPPRLTTGFATQLDDVNLEVTRALATHCYPLTRLPPCAGQCEREGLECRFSWSISVCYMCAASPILAHALTESDNGPGRPRFLPIREALQQCQHSLQLDIPPRQSWCSRIFATATCLPAYLGVHNHYSQLSYFWESIRVTVTVTAIIFPVMNYITVMSPLQL